MTTKNLLRLTLAGFAAVAFVGFLTAGVQAQPPQEPPASPDAVEPGPPPPPPEAGAVEDAPPAGQFRGPQGRRGTGGRDGQFRGPHGPRGGQQGHTPGECDQSGPHGKADQGRMGAGASDGPRMGQGRPMGPPPFEAIDADGNGAITKADWDQFHAQHRPPRPDGPAGMNRGDGPRGPRGPNAPDRGFGGRGPRAQVEFPGPPPAAE
ncbi:MAG: hypothetical protein KJ060_09760 [Candidatus Hydrogenedentes bacterium]|nr:hypothetical protein [Candidatus Hydrogenedentota bacterium]